MPFAVTWLNLETVTLSEASQAEKDKHHKTLLTCGILKKKKKGTNEPTYKTETESPM